MKSKINQKTGYISTTEILLNSLITRRLLFFQNEYQKLKIIIIICKQNSEERNQMKILFKTTIKRGPEKNIFENPEKKQEGVRRLFCDLDGSGGDEAT